MSTGLTLKGSIDVGSGCGSPVSGCGSGIDKTVRSLAFACGSAFFETVVSTDVGLRIATPGLPGASFIDLDLLGDLTSVEFLFVRSDQAIVLRIGAAAARRVSVGFAPPTGFVGAETLNLVVDGVPVAVVFLVGDQTAAQVVARINAACALAGLPTPRASVTDTAQIAIEGVLTGVQGSVEVVGGTGAATLGLAIGTSIGLGNDVTSKGLFLNQWPQTGSIPGPPSRIQVSGVATIDVLAGGRSSS